MQKNRVDVQEDSSLEKINFRLSEEHHSLLKGSLLKRKGDLSYVLNEIIKTTELDVADVEKFAKNVNLKPRSCAHIEKEGVKKVKELIELSGATYSSVVNSFIKKFIEEKMPELLEVEKETGNSVSRKITMELSESTSQLVSSLAKQSNSSIAEVIETAVYAFWLRWKKEENAQKLEF